jgi:hypothetical protein
MIMAPRIIVTPNEWSNTEENSTKDLFILELHLPIDLENDKKVG